MPVIETALTVAAAIGLFRQLLRIFRHAATWLRNRNPLLYIEDDRMIRTLNAYLIDHQNQNEYLPANMNHMVYALQERSQDWGEAQYGAEGEGQYYDDGYTTDYDTYGSGYDGYDDDDYYDPYDW